jgi:1-acyl-sn-glycerol-3-phosphate acyltransferase
MIPGRRYIHGSVRTALVVYSVVESLVCFVPLYLVAGGRLSTARRAEWLHDSCARLARRLSLTPSVRFSGGHDAVGLVVSNHLTYLDILLYSAARPFLFVAKSEVRRWPFLGTMARLGGTIFVDRGRTLQAPEASRQIEQGLREGLPVLLFPEGTSSDGSSVLPFRSPLFDPAIRTGALVTAAAIRYHADDAAEDQVSYWGDMVFAPHLFRTMCIRGLGAEISFDSPRRFPDRKNAAREAWRQVQSLREQADQAVVAELV